MSHHQNPVLKWVWFKLKRLEGQTAGFGFHISTFQVGFWYRVFEPQPFG